MTTVEKLNNLISIKQDIKTAIENKGVDMTGVSFLGYASKIGEIVSGVGYIDRDVIEGRYQYNISNSASFVYSSAFEYKAVQTVDLPNCLYVGSNGFYYCVSLTTVNMPVCTSLYNNAFRNCTNLTTVSLPACTSLYNNAFRSCWNLSSISLPNVTRLSTYCLANCSALQTISLPKCSYLSGYAFWSCYNLNTIYMGIELSTVASMVSSNALSDCSALQSIYVPASLVDAYKSAENWSYYSSIIYPFVRPSLLFDSTTGLLSGYCNYLHFSSEMDSFLSDNNIDRASITQISLPLLEYIDGFEVFAGCSNLISVSLPVCEYIGNEAFSGCTSLSDVYIPNCSTVGPAAFKKCKALQNISLPVCSSIELLAFKSTNINNIVLGSTSVCILMLNTAFADTPIASGTGSIYVPASLVSAYKSAENWSYYSNRIYSIR